MLCGVLYKPQMHTHSLGIPSFPTAAGQYFIVNHIYCSDALLNVLATILESIFHKTWKEMHMHTSIEAFYSRKAGICKHTYVTIVHIAIQTEKTFWLIEKGPSYRTALHTC